MTDRSIFSLRTPSPRRQGSVARAREVQVPQLPRPLTDEQVLAVARQVADRDSELMRRLA